MANITTHVLDAVNGCAAEQVGVSCTRIWADGHREQLFTVQTDNEGRINETVTVPEGDDSEYELFFATAEYFDRKGVAEGIRQIMRGVVVRISMPDPESRYHIPVIVSPHSQSMWWSA